MKYVIRWEKQDRVTHDVYGAGTVVDADYYNDDGDWVYVGFDAGGLHYWFGGNVVSGFSDSELRPERLLPTPPKFASIEDANAWLDTQS